MRHRQALTRALTIRVNLCEKNDSLGGLQRYVDFTKWRWSYKDFKDYLIRQTYKHGVEVLFNIEATPEMIKARGYNTVLVAVGDKLITPRVHGVDGRDVFNILDAYRKMSSLGKNVVLIGGGVAGSETGICLALSGHKVTVITGEKQLIPDTAIGPHNKEHQFSIFESHANFSYVLEAITTRISDGKVNYKDAKGSKKSIRADSVVIYGGLRPRMEEALRFSDSACQVLLLGDCTGRAGTLQKTIRSAFFIASQV